MLSRLLAAGTLVSAALTLSVLPSHADETLPLASLAFGELTLGDLALGDLALGDLALGDLALGDLAAVQPQNISAGQQGHGDPFGNLTMLNNTRLSAVNAGVSVRNSVFGPGTGGISTGPIHEIHLENVQGITNIALNTGINSNIQQSVSVNYVIRLPAE